MKTTVLPSEKAAKIVNDLTLIGEQMETLHNPQWLIVAKAAAMLEALRLGLLAIEAQPGAEVRHA